MKYRLHFKVYLSTKYGFFFGQGHLSQAELDTGPGELLNLANFPETEITNANYVMHRNTDGY